MSKMDKYLDLSFHNPAWSEMTLTEQGEIRDAAAAELVALQSALAEAREVIEFYGENKTWLSPSNPQYGDGITYADLEENSPVTKRKFVGGKRARAWLEKHG